MLEERRIINVLKQLVDNSPSLGGRPISQRLTQMHLSEAEIKDGIKSGRFTQSIPAGLSEEELSQEIASRVTQSQSLATNIKKLAAFFDLQRVAIMKEEENDARRLINEVTHLIQLELTDVLPSRIIGRVYGPYHLKNNDATALDYVLADAGKKEDQQILKVLKKLIEKSRDIPI